MHTDYAAASLFCQLLSSWLAGWMLRPFIALSFSQGASHALHSQKVQLVRVPLCYLWVSFHCRDSGFVKHYCFDLGTLIFGPAPAVLSFAHVYSLDWVVCPLLLPQEYFSFSQISLCSHFFSVVKWDCSNSDIFNSALTSKRSSWAGLALWIVRLHQPMSSSPLCFSYSLCTLQLGWFVSLIPWQPYESLLPLTLDSFSYSIWKDFHLWTKGCIMVAGDCHVSRKAQRAKGWLPWLLIWGGAIMKSLGEYG
jgi:hypothetical protein